MTAFSGDAAVDGGSRASGDALSPFNFFLQNIETPCKIPCFPVYPKFILCSYLEQNSRQHGPMEINCRKIRNPKNGRSYTDFNATFQPATSGIFRTQTHMYFNELIDNGNSF